MNSTVNRTPQLLHATAVSINNHGILLRGPSGAGKSDLALRILSLTPEALGAFGAPPLDPITLIADDQVEVEAVDGRALARAPASIRGRLEVRGLGIVRVLDVARAPLALVVDLIPRENVQRMPLVDQSAEIAGCQLPRIGLHAFEPSAALKVALALNAAWIALDPPLLSWRETAPPIARKVV